MELGVKVNAAPVGNAESRDTFPFPENSLPQRIDYGPCLYLGPAGQRCNRRAAEGGFCPQHTPGAKSEMAPGKSGTRRAIAIMAALAALLPWLTDLIRELIRLLK